MTQDPVVEEVPQGRSLTARYGNDVSALLRILEERARVDPRGVVDTVKVVAGERFREVQREPRRRYTKRTLLETYRRAGLPLPRVTYFSALLFAPIAAVRWACRLWPAPAEGRSDFEMSRPGFMNELLAALMALERLVVGRVPLPVGTSLLAVSSATTAR